MEYWQNILSRYRQKGIMVDTNLLLLFIVGSCDKDRIATFKRTKMYTIEDYDLLIEFVRNFNRLIATPNILTEVSDFLGQLPSDFHQLFFKHFAKNISNFKEIFTSSTDIASLDYFGKFGLTDSGIIKDAPNNYFVLTDDFKLYNYLCFKNIDAINFNYIRMSKWRKG
jgi:hypothetical protein